MNMTPEMKRFVREEVARQLNVILSGVCEGTEADAQSESIGALYPGSPTIENRPVMHPYGYASRAPKGVLQVTAKQGASPQNRLVIGHRDADRPDDLEEGETEIYSSGGWSVRVKNDSIIIGNGEQEFVLDGSSWTLTSGDWSIEITDDGVTIGNGTTLIELTGDEAKITQGEASWTVNADGVQAALGAAGKFSLTNGQGEFLASLIQILQNSVAGGYPLIPDPTGLAVLQSMQE